MSFVDHLLCCDWCKAVVTREPHTGRWIDYRGVQDGLTCPDGRTHSVQTVQWHVFDNSEAKGEIGVRNDVYGLGLYLRDADEPEGMRRFALIDLFYQSPEWQAQHEQPEHVPMHLNVVIDSVAPHRDECVLFVRIFPDRILVEPEAQVTLERERPTWSRQRNDVSYRVVEHGAGEP